MRKIVTGLGIFCLSLVMGQLLLMRLVGEPTSKTIFGQVLAIVAAPKQPESQLPEVVEEALLGSKGIYAVVVRNLKTEEEYYLLEDRPFKAGSIYKLWVMATAFLQIEQGTLDQEEILSSEIAKLNEFYNIAPDEAELTSGVISLSVKSALTQMITISHNYAALLLSKRVGAENVRKFLTDNDLSHSVFTGGPMTTALDTADFLEKLYRGKIASESSTVAMLDLLKNQKLNEKLPKYLPDEVVVAHKTGEIDYFSHDGGIVYGPKGDYIIVVFSQSESPYGAEERIAQISKAVYDYFQRI